MNKAAKKAIRAILSDADVNDEELMTTFTGVEALMNSSPLTYQSANLKDVTPLTKPFSPWSSRRTLSTCVC